jgi:hypothetical protein
MSDPEFRRKVELWASLKFPDFESENAAIVLETFAGCSGLKLSRTSLKRMAWNCRNRID